MVKPDRVVSGAVADAADVERGHGAKVARGSTSAEARLFVDVPRTEHYI